MSDLKDELLNDPLGIGYSKLDDVSCSTVLNKRNRNVINTITKSEFIIWAAQGPMAVIEDTALTIGHPLRASALALRAFIYGNSEVLDLSNGGIKTLLSGWIQAGLITQAEYIALKELATHKISRAEELGMGFIHASQVRDAR